MKLYSFLLVVCCVFLSCSAQRICLYALCTDSHEILKNDYFLPSLQDDFNVIIQSAEQTSPTATFMSQGWVATTIKKVDLIIRAIEENWGSFFIFSDVDIQFFQPIEKTIVAYMKEYDLVIQKNNPSGVLCSGFFACRGNEKTLQLWKDVKKMMENDTSLSDQISLNKCIKRKSKKNPYDISWAYLPDTFFGGGTLTGRLWHKNDELFVPEGIMMHHANWTQGISNKIAQLEYVQKVVRQRTATQKLK